jgi:hypothetical protein
MKHWLLVSAALVAIPAGARADETIKFREVMHYVSVQSQDVGDVEGHAVVLGHGSGIASFPDGTVGTVSFVNTLDYVKGSGAITLVYVTLTLGDGSTLRTKGAGSTAVTGGKSEYKGWSVCRGEGRRHLHGCKATIIGHRCRTLRRRRDQSEIADLDLLPRRNAGQRGEIGSPNGD